MCERLGHRGLEENGVVDGEADVGGDVTKADDAHAFLAVELEGDLFKILAAGHCGAVRDQIACVVTDQGAESDEHCGQH